MDFSINLYPESISIADNGLLKHQDETVTALENFPIVLNCAMTGAGKTKASHLSIKTYAYDKDVLFVAPTNALVSQHLEDAKAFVKKNNLSHHVVAVDGETLNKLRRKRKSIYRVSEILHQLIYNPREFSDELGLSNKHAPLWLITNPDQIWISIVSGHGRRLDIRNLLKDFINNFRFIVVDEFHYYTAEQLVLFFLCIALWKHFGQFDDGLKMLLLTATPNEIVENFFKKMEINFKVIGNENQSNSNCTPVISPVELKLSTGYIHDFKDFILERYDQGEDGVVISDSLIEINKLYNDFEKLGISVGRITGPINNKSRKIESQQRLILATPTVDLGFNFIKPHYKDRQEIDFIVANTRTKSHFWQRLGRAGRVLGKNQTEIPSKAVMLLPNQTLYENLRPFEHKWITRANLKELLTLSDKTLKINSLAREGLFIASKQLLEIEKMLPQEQIDIAEKIFNTLKICFDSQNFASDWPSVKKRHNLSKMLQKIDDDYPELKIFHINKWINNKSERNEENIKSADVLLNSWAKNYFYKKNKLSLYNDYIKENDCFSLIQTLFKKNQSLKQSVIEYYKEQMLRLNYLFSFRGDGFKNQVFIYDPQYLHSPHIINTIELTYLLAKYEFKGPISKASAEKEWSCSLPNSELFFKITNFLDFPYRPIFEYSYDLPTIPVQREDSEEIEILPAYYRTIALHNLSLRFENKKIGPLQIPIELTNQLKGLSELFFITPMENSYALNNWLKEYDIQTAILKADREHSVVYGKDAIFISEELYFKRKNEEC
ncbi:MAG: type I-D CRISPR-associated helicase Cas3' [Desulfobacterales bacterium]|nr:type I-D CRISPR-associated helicase Cas3' [Desulfobacterales bacterium]